MTIQDLRQLECFVAVAEEGHIGRAAERLHMTQPPLTRRLQRLESEVGAQLFTREPTGMRLTSAGEVFLREAEAVLAQLDEGVARTRRADAGDAGPLVVGSFGSPVFDLLPRLLRAFRRGHPGVEIFIERVAKSDQAQAIRRGAVHLGFGRHYRPEADITIRRIATDPLSVAVPESHPLAGEAEVTVSDLADEPMILYPRDRPSFADRIVGLCEEERFQPLVAREAEAATIAIAYVAVGHGLTVVPRSALRVSMSGVVFVPLAGGHSEDFSCIHLTDHRQPVVTAMLDFLAGWDSAADDGATVTD